MGFEVQYFFHPRKEEGGYDTSKREEKSVKVGKPFDDTTLESLAAAIMAQLARRDVWVVDVKISELVKHEVAFKECKDGKGIVLKNKRFSFNEAAQMVAEDVAEEAPQVLQNLPEGVQPHELVVVQKNQQIEDLYANPNKPVPIQRSQIANTVNQKKVLYKVYFDPDIRFIPEVQRMKLKFTQDKEYPVHQLVPHPTGNLSMQKLVVTDDLGRPVTIDEKYFTTVGTGLYADKQLGFSGSSGRGVRKPKLAFEDEMYIESPTENQKGRRPNIPDGIPVDDGTIPDELLRVPDIRPGKR